MPPWLSQINSAQRKESKFDSYRWVQLATIGIDNTPRVRTVVFRGWSESYEMEIYTDKRSQKYYELDLNNKVEICWLFLKSKCQFRFRGTASFDITKANQKHWDSLSEKSKCMWSWPCPGELFVNQPEKAKKIRTDDLSDNFALIKIDINYVDQLILNSSVHKRRKWILNKEWKEERINP